MTADPTSESTPYRVVVNDEQQYSIWFVDRQLPSGWSDAEYRGTREDCLAHIANVWTDMRPLSVRQEGVRVDVELAENDETDDDGSVVRRSLPHDQMAEGAATAAFDE